VLHAVLFDWGGTLVQSAWEPELLAAGHAAGLRALGRDPLPELTARFEQAYLPLVETEEYSALIRRLLGEHGIDATDDELLRFVEAEHAAWAPAHQLASTTHALLETLRDRGLKLGLVSNAFDPPALLHRDLEELGIAQRIDVAVFSSELGLRKPDPAIFRHVLDALGVEPAAALYVGDSLTTDIAGAAAVGMHTCQALWFNADDEPDVSEPDFQAFTQMDVLTVVTRLGRSGTPFAQAEEAG
jgi:putative hydrolase of the HAD superfamily